MQQLDKKQISDQRFIRQFEVVSEASSTQQDRAEFISNPLEYARSRGVELDKEFAGIIKEELILIERYAAALGCNNYHLKTNGVVLEPVMRKSGVSCCTHPGAAPVAVLAAIQAASAAVQSVTSIHMAMEFI